VAEFADVSNKKFDSSINWSIMISDHDNEIRNQIMRSVKNKQMKRQLLHDFIRQEKIRLRINRQVPAEETTLASSSTGANNSPKGKKAVDKQTRFKEFGAKKDELETRLKSEFTEYTKSIVTKQSANPKN
jgi:hypothetical protein